MTRAQRLFPALVASIVGASLFAIAQEGGPSAAPEKPTNAVRAPIGSFVLVRRGNDAVALQLTGHTTTGDGGARYEWWYQPDGSGDFARPNVEKGMGEVFESYERTPNPDGSKTVRDKGGKLYVGCGPFSLQWSSGDWIYFPERRDQDLEIAETAWDRIADVKIADPSLRWIASPAKRVAHSVECKNRLRIISMAAHLYADDHNGAFPWPKGAEKLTEEQALDCFAVLYRENYVDSTDVFVCPASGDAPAEKIEIASERRSFRLERKNCSYTWRNRVTTVNDDSRTPIAADRFGLDHDGDGKIGRNVVLKAANVVFLENPKPGSLESKEARRARLELFEFAREPALK
jgi:hypothetical protein